MQIRLLFHVQYPHQQSCRQVTIHCTVQNTMQSYYSRKARGQNTVHKQWPVTVHSTVPQQNHWSYYCFRLKRYSPEGKSISLPMIPAVFWMDPRLPPSIKGSLFLSLQQAQLSQLPQSFLLCTQKYFVIRMALLFTLPLVYSCTRTTFVTYLCFRPQCPLNGTLCLYNIVYNKIQLFVIYCIIQLVVKSHLN